jgi:chloride channel 3/4/5
MTSTSCFLSVANRVSDICPVSLVVIMFELTGALSHVLPIMISVMLSKWVGDAFGKEGIYARWIALRAYPWLQPGEHRDEGEIAGSRMRRVGDCVCLVEGAHTLKELESMTERYGFEGFPVTTGSGELLGYVERRRLKGAISELLPESVFFSH